MRNDPTAAELLDLAREKLTQELIPALPREQRYNALLVAAAIGVALRESEAGEEPYAAFAEELAALYGDWKSDTPSLFRHLAQEIRDGALDEDGDYRDDALSLLRALTLHKLGESNPGYLRDG